jgi:integrase
LESDLGVWRNYIAPRFGRRPVASITAAEVSAWLGDLLRRGLARSTVTRALATLRSLLSFAVADGRVTVNVAAAAKAPTGGQARREGKFLDLEEVAALAAACRGRYGELVYVLAFQGLRWGELAGLQVADRVMVPGRGLRLSRAVLASNGGGALYVDTLKNKRARTVPLVPAVVPIVDRWSIGKGSSEWLFAAPEGGPLRETNWKRSVGWYQAKAKIGRPELRVHDLRHTAASSWLGAGADPKVVQRVLGHASAAMTMDLYGHLIDRNLWDAADRFGGTTGASSDEGSDGEGGALVRHPAD